MNGTQPSCVSLAYLVCLKLEASLSGLELSVALESLGPCQLSRLSVALKDEQTRELPSHGAIALPQGYI